jgi:hypothetical protein
MSWFEQLDPNQAREQQQVKDNPEPYRQHEP